MAVDHDDIDKRLERVRSAIATAATGLEGPSYVAFFGRLLSDAEGWRMELEEMEEAEEETEEDV